MEEERKTASEDFYMARERTKELRDGIQYTVDVLNSVSSHIDFAIRDLRERKKAFDETAISGKHQYLLADMLNTSKIVEEYISQLVLLQGKVSNLANVGKNISEYLLDKTRFYEERAKRAGL